MIHLGPIILPTIRLYVFGAAAGCVLLLEVLLNWTWFGRALRALVQNRYAGQIVGVNDQKVASLTFGIGIGFAGLAGALLASLYSFNPDFGRPFLIRAFVIIVLGGLESVPASRLAHSCCLWSKVSASSGFLPATSLPFPSACWWWC